MNQMKEWLHNNQRLITLILAIMAGLLAMVRCFGEQLRGF